MLQNEIIELCVLEELHIDIIQKWHNDFSTTQNTTLTSYIPRNYDEEVKWFQRRIGDDTNRVFIIKYKETNENIGFISYSGLDYRNQKVLLSIVIGEESYRGKGIASQALKLFESYLKNEFNIRKITVQVLDFNTPSLNLFQRNGYVTEGILKEEIFRNGKFCDLYLLSKFLK